MMGRLVKRFFSRCRGVYSGLLSLDIECVGGFARRQQFGELWKVFTCDDDVWREARVDP